METQVIDAGGVSVAVRVSEGRGTPIVLCHGNSCSMRCYQFQLESELAKRHRFIALDFPGHGDSPPAKHPETTYTAAGYSSTIAAVARALDAERGIFVGWSLGGYAVLEAIPKLPRALGFLVFGAPPIAGVADLAHAMSSDPDMQAGFRAEVSDAELATCVRHFVAPGFPVPPAFVEDFRRTDPRARACLAASIGRGEVSDEAKIVAAMPQPLAMIHGELDSIALSGQFQRVKMPTLWRGQVQYLPGVGHAPQWERPQRFNELLEAFVRDCEPRA